MAADVEVPQDHSLGQHEAEKPPGPYGVRLRLPHCHQRRDHGTDSPSPPSEEWGSTTADLVVLCATEEAGPWMLLRERGLDQTYAEMTAATAIEDGPGHVVIVCSQPGWLVVCRPLPIEPIDGRNGRRLDRVWLTIRAAKSLSGVDDVKADIDKKHIGARSRKEARMEAAGGCRLDVDRSVTLLATVAAFPSAPTPSAATERLESTTQGRTLDHWGRRVIPLHSRLGGSKLPVTAAGKTRTASDTNSPASVFGLGCGGSENDFSSLHFAIQLHVFLHARENASNITYYFLTHANA
eukprot:SAG31_NODE_1851_length_7077_cov_2.680854_5_plen_295_part_00